MDEFEQRAKESVAEAIEQIKKKATITRCVERIETVFAAVKLLAEARFAILNAQVRPPLATIERAAHAMGVTAAALPTQFNLERANAFLSVAADKERYEAWRHAEWLAMAPLMAQILFDTAHRMAIAIEAFGVWSDMFSGVQFPVKSGPFTPDESLATIRELLAPTDESLKELSDLLSRTATIGVKNQHGRALGNRSQQKTKEEHAKEWQQRADQIWERSPGLSVFAVAKHIANEYPEDERPSPETIRKLIKRPSRPNKSAKKHLK